MLFMPARYFKILHHFFITQHMWGYQGVFSRTHQTSLTLVTRFKVYSVHFKLQSKNRLKHWLPWLSWLRRARMIRSVGGRTTRATKITQNGMACNDSWERMLPTWEHMCVTTMMPAIIGVNDVDRIGVCCLQRRVGRQTYVCWIL